MLGILNTFFLLWFTIRTAVISWFCKFVFIDITLFDMISEFSYSDLDPFDFNGQIQMYSSCILLWKLTRWSKLMKWLMLQQNNQTLFKALHQPFKAQSLDQMHGVFRHPVFHGLNLLFWLFSHHYIYSSYCLFNCKLWKKTLKICFFCSVILEKQPCCLGGQYFFSWPIRCLN